MKSPTVDVRATVVSGTSDEGNTVVWGTSIDEDGTVVWGTTRTCDPNDPPTEECDNVVWGTELAEDDEDNVVWGTWSPIRR